MGGTLIPMRLALWGMVSLVVLALAPAAQAAQRYAAVSGAGTACSAAVPCSLEEAVTKAKDNDEVIVAAGTYNLKEGLYTGPSVNGVDVHGAPGGPLPQIVGAESGTALVSIRDSLSYLDVTNTASESPLAVSCGPGDRIERVRAAASGPEASAIFQYGDCLVRDSLALATGPKSRGIYSSSYEGYEAVVRNVTAIATGAGSAGILGSTLIIAGAQSHAVNLRNTIADGAEADLRAIANATYSVAATITVANSNFDAPLADPGASIVDAGGNQAAPPLFVGAGGSDYREAAGSPTIDAGALDPLSGAADLLGSARTVGAAPDIGAFEFVPPAPPALPAGEIRSLAIAPKAFRTVNLGAAIVSAKKKVKAPVSATVTYDLSAATTVAFSVERKLVGRKVGKRCLKKTKANADRKKCPLFKPLKGGFSHAGAAGGNKFKFSGRLDKALAPGSYRLTGKTSAASRSASFKIVK